MPLFWCLTTLWVPNQNRRRWIAFGCPPKPGEDGRHRWAGKERTGGSGNICKRGMPDHRHLQVEETHEEETSIPQVGWSWTIPRLDPILIHQYQLLTNLIEVIDQSQERQKSRTPCKHWVSWLVYQQKTNLCISSSWIPALPLPASGD